MKAPKILSSLVLVCQLQGRHLNSGCDTGHPSFALDSALRWVVRKSQQLFACLVSDETVPGKSEVCYFFSKADAKKFAVMGKTLVAISIFVHLWLDWMPQQTTCTRSRSIVGWSVGAELSLRLC